MRDTPWKTLFVCVAAVVIVLIATIGVTTHQTKMRKIEEQEKVVSACLAADHPASDCTLLGTQVGR